MKTATIELPDAVFGNLEREAARQHQTLAGYIAGLLECQASLAQPLQTARREPDLPVIRSDAPGQAYITNELLAEIEEQEDAEHYARLAGR
jgi:hypothetical protein